MKATDIQDKHFRMLLMSPYGSGKTHIIGMIHEMLKKAGTKGVYLFDFDQGVQTLASAKFDVEFDHYLDGKQDYDTAFERFQRKYNTFEADTQGYGAIAMDSLTMMQKSCMKYVHRINKIKRQLGFLSNQNDYGVLIDLLTQMFPQFLDLSRRMSIILTAHTKERDIVIPGSQDANAEGGNQPIVVGTEILPAVIGKSLPSQIGMWFNECWYLRSEANAAMTTRKVQTASDSEVHCKTQVADMPFLCPVNDALKRLGEAYGIVNKSELRLV